MATLSAIRIAAPALRPSERRVADVCVAHPHDVALAAGEVAAQTSTSTATVTRACQHLGFTGFTQLRMLLRILRSQRAGPLHLHRSPTASAS